MNIQTEVLRRWALHQIRRATPTVFAPELSRRERLQTRMRYLDQAAALAEHHHSLSGPQRPA